MMKKLLSLLLVLAMCLSLLPAVVAAEGEHRLSDMEYDTLLLVNMERAKEGLAPLTSLPELQRGTDIRATELVSNLSHVRPDGSNWYTVFYDIDTPTYKYAGENIAAGFVRAVDVMDAWMHSDAHRKNIMHSNFVHMGNGYYYTDDSQYLTQWVQIFFTSHDCHYTSMTVEKLSEEPVVLGTSVEELRLLACLNCKTCGKSYLPVSESYCTGYDPNKTGKQTLTVTALGLTATIKITIPGDEPEPTEPTETEPEPTEPEPTEPEPVHNPFTDVKESDYFYAPVLWAVEEGITTGATKTTFSPEKPCTRAQVVTFLWRACGSPEPASTVNPFTDVAANTYYYKAVLWAVEQGITTGATKTTFEPESTCTRGQVATFLWRAQGKPTVTNSNNPFSDVKSTDYYYNPILWAVENKVTQGTGKGKFSPEDDCTRGQIVTFLYRTLAN